MKFSIFVLTLFLVACAKPIKPIAFEPTGIKQAAKTHAFELKFVDVSYAKNSIIENEALLLPYFILLWKEAVQSSLHKSKVFSDEEDRKVTVRVKIKKFWLSMNSNSSKHSMEVEARYEVVRRSSGIVLYEETIKSDNSGGYSSLLTLTKTWNKAVQSNILRFIDDLGKSTLK